jgi:putative hemolysin
MSEIGGEIVVIFLLIVANGIFALSEMAIVTAQKSRLQDWANKGNRRARIVLELASLSKRFLSTVQIGITVMVILVGALGGTTLAERTAQYFATIPGLEPYSRVIGISAMVIMVAYFSLVLGAMIPKRLALRHPESIATFIAGPMRVVAKIAAPVVHLLNLSTDAVFKLFGRHSIQEPTVTEEKIKTLVQEGTKAGVFEESEQDLVEAVFSLGDRSARSLMTPRSQIVWLDLADSTDAVITKIVESQYSRFPVSSGDLDQVSGVIHVKDLLPQQIIGKPIDMRALLQEPSFVPRSVSALHVLELFKQTGKHIAFVVDEYGGIEGLLTHHDILEAITGEIAIGERHGEPKAVQRHDGSWLLDGMLAVDEFKEIFQLEELPGEKRDAFQTLGGFLFTQFGRVPAVSDSFVWNSLRFEIVDMDGKRIDKVLVISTQQPAAEMPSTIAYDVRKRESLQMKKEGEI